MKIHHNIKKINVLATTMISPPTTRSDCIYTAPFPSPPTTKLVRANKSRRQEEMNDTTNQRTSTTTAATARTHQRRMSPHSVMDLTQSTSSSYPSADNAKTACNSIRRSTSSSIRSNYLHRLGFVDRPSRNRSIPRDYTVPIKSNPARFGTKLCRIEAVYAQLRGSTGATNSTPFPDTVRCRCTG